jgi:hypothetical protein
VTILIGKTFHFFTLGILVISFEGAVSSAAAAPSAATAPSAAAASSAANLPMLKGIPESSDAAGRAFAEAWVAFRQDMDGLCAAKVSGEESEAWLNAMPEFLLRDILRLAVDHEVIYQAAIRLAGYKSDLNRRTISTLRSRYDGQMLGKLLGAALIAAGDIPFRKTTNAALKSPVWERRAAAAVTAAASGDRSALEYLSKALKKEGEESPYAAWALGRFGGQSEEQLLRAQIGLLPSEPALKAALGELVFKRIFKELYEGFLQQYRFYADGTASDGLYETWFILIEQAVSEGVTKPDALRAAVMKMREKPAFGQDRDLWDRRLASFVDFLDGIKKRQEGPKQAEWPKDFASAQAAIRFLPKTDQESERNAARRIAAALAILSSLGSPSGYAKMAEPTPFLNAPTPGGDRAIDGNIATSWHFRKNAPFLLEHSSGERLQTIQVLLWCPAGTQTNAPIVAASIPLTVSGIDTAGVPWTVTAPLHLSQAAFQQIPINRNSAKRIQIDIPQSIDRSAVCISEIRCQFGDRPARK